MAIILPEQQTGFGLAGSPRLTPGGPNAGDALATIGDVGVGVAVQRRKIMDDRAVREARLNAMDGLDQARVAYENDTNLDGLTDRWQEDAKAVVDAAGKALPAYLQADFALSLGDVVGSQTSAIRSRENALFRDQATSQLNGDRRRYASLAANAPTDEARNAIYGAWAEAVGAAQDAGIISQVDADQLMVDLPTETEAIAAMKLISEDPAAYLADRAAGKLGSLPPDQAAKFDIAAKANLDQATAARAKADVVAAAAADVALGDRASDAVKLIEGGLAVADLPVLLNDLAGTPHYDRVQGAIDAAQTGGNFALMTPADQQAELQRIRSAGSKNPSDVGLVNRLEDMAAKTAASLADDALAHVRDRGIAPLPPVDVFDPASVAARVATAEAVYDEFTPGAPTIAYFDKAEAAELAGVVGGTNVDDALRVLAGITQNYGDRAPMALAQIGAQDPNLALAGALLLDTGDVTAARTLLEGRRMKAAGTGASVSIDIQRQVVAEVAAAFPASDGARLDTLTNAALAHYAASGQGVADPKSDEAMAALRASVQAVTGARTQNGVQYGGIQPVNGVSAVLPPSLSAGQVEQALIYFPADAWARASSSGGPPMMSSQPMLERFTQSNRENLTVLSLGGGEYALGYRYASGEVRYMSDPKQADGLFRFDLERLITGVSRGN